jgi:hypothetical protein
MPDPARAARVPLYAAGLLLTASGLFHLGVWAARGGPWFGPLAWRKPILFGLSAGLTALSLGWVLGLLRRRWRLDAALAWLAAAALVAEVGLITLQTWRGVESHFNYRTPFDAAVAQLMSGLILAVSLYALVQALRSLGPLDAAPDLALAVRAGLALLVLACALGFLIQAVAERQAAAGGSGEFYGAAGILKFPHGTPLHALQALPALAWLTARSGWEMRRRVAAVAAAAAGVALLTGYSLAQTFAGRGRGDLTPLGGALLALGAVAVVVPAAAALATLRRRTHGAAGERSSPTPDEVAGSPG